MWFHDFDSGGGQDNRSIITYDCTYIPSYKGNKDEDRQVRVKDVRLNDLLDKQ